MAILEAINVKTPQPRVVWFELSTCHLFWGGVHGITVANSMSGDLSSGESWGLISSLYIHLTLGMKPVWKLIISHSCYWIVQACLILINFLCIFYLYILFYFYGQTDCAILIIRVSLLSHFSHLSRVVVGYNGPSLLERLSFGSHSRHLSRVVARPAVLSL